ncbi:MAG: tRNA (adenosine(37)-N6)-threonylcarbamoyltransferase complex transferase subunit TsaD [Candidatus Pacebacteria bacterium]|nr:tRNA (adenosine(37)-N6)-threonylcarbamoyltransferase complex transferase subunit TsaD [Candidatus Paceibacterota bacterium]
MKILSIETSCDETAVSIIEASGDLNSPRFTILGNALYSQISTHAEYGGVFPALAKREHTLNLVPMLKLATEEAFEHASKATQNGAENSTNQTTNKKSENAQETANTELSAELRAQILEILSRENDLGPALLDFLDTHEVFGIDAIAVTQGPGLEPALWVGISFAKALALALNKPIIPVNHMEGHIVSVLTESTELDRNDDIHNSKTNRAVQFPALALLISGGHTELVLSKDWHQYEVIGQTVDDAVGEAFDKVARLMNLPYPGGPKISRLAAESRAENLREKYKTDTTLSYDAGLGEYPWTLPRPMLKSSDFNFSFSGLKTAVLYAVKDKLKNRTDIADISANISTKELHSEHIASKDTPQLSEIEIKTLAEEFENAVTDVLVHKTRKAIEETNAQTLIIGGGVIANTHIREAFKKVADQTGVQLFTPSVSLSTDNSVMIGVAGYLRWIAKDKGILMPENLRKIDGTLDNGDFSMEKLAEFRANGNLSL